MLAELEPAKEITGGPWYGIDGKLDASFIEGMQQAVLGFIHARGPATTADILNFIEEKKVCQLALQSDDISLLLNNLVYEGTLESCDDGAGETIYRLVRRIRLVVYFEATASGVKDYHLNVSPIIICPKPCRRSSRILRLPP